MKLLFLAVLVPSIYFAVVSLPDVSLTNPILDILSNNNNNHNNYTPNLIPDTWGAVVMIAIVSFFALSYNTWIAPDAAYSMICLCLMGLAGGVLCGLYLVLGIFDGFIVYALTLVLYGITLFKIIPMGLHNLRLVFTQTK